MSTPHRLSSASVSPARLGAQPRDLDAAAFYFEWKRTLGAPERGGRPFTPATSTVERARVALDIVLAEGLEAIGSAPGLLAAAAGRACWTSGSSINSRPRKSCSLVTAIKVPEGAARASCGARGSQRASS